MKVQKDKIND